MNIIYDKHENDYKGYLTDNEKLKIANSWLRLDTIDYWRHNRMLSLLKPFMKKNERWLTIGDGRYGSESAWLKRHGISSHATDMHTHLLNLAYKKDLIESFSFQNAEQLDFESETFDYVYGVGSAILDSQGRAIAGISISGTKPAKQPIIEPNKSFFLFEIVCAKIAPKAP